jgi:hypothetical protein
VIIDFHTHVFAPMDDAAFVNSDFHRRVMTAANRGQPQPHSMENVLRAQKEGGIDATVISNPLHVLRDLDADQQLDLVKRHNRYIWPSSRSTISSTDLHRRLSSAATALFANSNAK